MFERGTLARAARDELARRIGKKSGAASPFAVATKQIKRMGSREIRELALAKVHRGPGAFHGPHPKADYLRTRKALGLGQGEHSMAKGNPKAAQAMRLHQRTGISLKAAWARVRGGGHGGGSMKKHHSGGHRSPARKSDPPASRGVSIGAAYLNAQLGQRIASPLIQEGLDAAVAKKLPSGAQFVTNMKPRVVSFGYAQNVGIAVADRWLDKKTGQAAAISRGSVTALAPELYDALETVKDARANGILAAHARYTIRQTAYNPYLGRPDYGYGFVTKRMLKHGGQALRLFASRNEFGRKIAAPIKKHVLSPLGLSF